MPTDKFVDLHQLLDTVVEAVASRVVAQLATSPRPTKPAKEWLRTAEVAELLQLKPQTLEIMRMHGEGPPFSKIGRAVRRNSHGQPIWMAIADEYGYRVGKDSAHRVVARLDPALHASIAHHCEVEKRGYP